MLTAGKGVGQLIRAGDVETNYFEAGSGEPLLLLHGSGVGVSAYANWQHSLPRFATGFRAIAFDVGGFGYSQPPEDAGYGLPYSVQHVADFMDALRIRRAHVVGNSFGGALALAFAVRHPSRVGRMVLMGSAGTDFAVPPAFGSGWNGD